MNTAEDYINFLYEKGYKETNTRSPFPTGSLAQTFQKQFKDATSINANSDPSGNKWSVMTVGKSEDLMDWVQVRFDYAFDASSTFSLKGMVAQSLGNIKTYLLAHPSELPTYIQAIQDLKSQLEAKLQASPKEALASYKSSLAMTQLVTDLTSHGYLNGPDDLTKAAKKYLQSLEAALSKAYQTGDRFHESNILLIIKKPYKVNRDLVEFHLTLGYHPSTQDFRVNDVSARLGKEIVFAPPFIVPRLPMANRLYVDLKAKQEKNKAAKMYINNGLHRKKSL